MTTKVWESCVCGAKFQMESEGDDDGFDVDYAASKFREAHAVCRQRLRTPFERETKTKEDRDG